MWLFWTLVIIILSGLTGIFVVAFIVSKTIAGINDDEGVTNMDLDEKKTDV